MIFEKNVEAAIMAKISAVLPSAWVSGSWQVASEGSVKDVEPEGVPVVVRVNVQPRAYDTQYAPMCSVAASIEIHVRADISPTGLNLVDASDKLFDLLETWQTDMDAALADLTVDGFTPTATRLDGGSGPVYDEDGTFWSVTQVLTINGVTGE